MGILKYKDKNGNWVTATAVAQDVEGMLKYTVQELTDEQKLQARTNIGFENAVNEKIKDVVRYTNQTLNDEQKTQIKTNIGLNDAITLSNIENNATEIKEKLEITSGSNYFMYNDINEDYYIGYPNNNFTFLINSSNSEEFNQIKNNDIIQLVYAPLHEENYTNKTYIGSSNDSENSCPIYYNGQDLNLSTHILNMNFPITITIRKTSDGFELLYIYEENKNQKITPEQISKGAFSEQVKAGPMDTPVKDTQIPSISLLRNSKIISIEDTSEESRVIYPGEILWLYG